MKSPKKKEKIRGGGRGGGWWGIRKLLYAGFKNPATDCIGSRAHPIIYHAERFVTVFTVKHY